MRKWPVQAARWSLPTPYIFQNACRSIISRPTAYFRIAFQVRNLAMYSDRTNWNIIPNELACLLAQKREAGTKVLDLTQSNPTEAGFLYPADPILAPLGQEQALLYSPSPRGDILARKSISDQYRKRGLEIDPDWIHLTASTSEGYSWLLKLLTDSDDRVAVPRPSYPLFDFLADLEHVHVDHYHLRFSRSAGWNIDFTSLEAILTPSTKAIVVVNPNNPTGSYLRDAEAAYLVSLCNETGRALISDEVFFDYPYGKEENRISLLDVNGDCPKFVLDGISKSLALPQMKLGWIIAHGHDSVMSQGRSRLDIIADTFLSVNTPAQVALPLWWDIKADLQSQIMKRCVNNLQMLARLAEGISSVEILSPSGGWSVVVEAHNDVHDETVARTLLEHENVYVHPGSYFDFRNRSSFVMSLLTAESDFSEGVLRFLRRIEAC